MAISAVRTRPGDFLLIADAIGVGDEFAAGGTTFRVVGDLVQVGARTYLATVRTIDGLMAGRTFVGHLRHGTSDKDPQHDQ